MQKIWGNHGAKGPVAAAATDRLSHYGYECGDDQYDPDDAIVIYEYFPTSLTSSDVFGTI